MFVCVRDWSCCHLNKVAGSLTADGVDLTVDDGDDLRQRQTDRRQTEQTETKESTWSSVAIYVKISTRGCINFFVQLLKQSNY